MKNLIKHLEKQNIFISIIFKRNANREKAWYFIVEDLESELFKSTLYTDKRECKKDAQLRALEIFIKDKKFTVSLVAEGHCLKVASNRIKVEYIK